MKSMLYTKVFLVLFTFFRMNNLYSQNIADIEEQIEICFVQLQSASANMPLNSNLNYYPIFEPYIFQSHIKDEKIITGALCKEFLFSEKLGLLKNIYKLYSNDETNSNYSLVDDNGNKVYDLLRHNCSPVGPGKVDTINQSTINELVNSYKKWYIIFKENGLKKIKKDNINPTSFSKYKWIKEIGYLSGIKTNTEILEKYIELKRDSNYLNYFIISQDLSRFYEGKTNTNIINEVLLLSLINNQISFTANILKFTLQAKEADISEVVQKLEVDRDTILLFQLLKEKNINIIMKM